MDPEFQENIEQYFVENIKVGHFYVHKGGGALEWSLDDKFLKMPR